jgi:hypothetical protein
MESILELTTANILLIQEPPWGQLVPTVSDSDPDGKVRKGTSRHRAWECLLPPASTFSTVADSRPRVAFFYRRRLATSCTFLPIPSLASYHSIGVDVHSSSFHLRLLCFYHHVPSNTHSLHPLLSFPFQPSIPTLIGGDFNTHSLFWSHPCQSLSSWAPVLEDWIDEHSLFLTVPDGSTTWQNSRSHSLIDLLFVNSTLLDFPLSPSSCEVSFALSFGSDHAGLLYSLPLPCPHSHPSPRKGWIIDDSKHDEWTALIRDVPIPTISSISDVHRAADELNTTLRFTADLLFDRRRPNPNGKYPWWNKECQRAAAALVGTTGDTRLQSRRALRTTLHDAKRTYFESLLTDPSTPIWDVAKWRHGRHETLIHPILSSAGTPTSDFNSMALTFKARFFDITTNGPMVSTPQALMPNASGAASTVWLRLENGEQVLRHLPALQVNLANGCPRPDQACNQPWVMRQHRAHVSSITGLIILLYSFGSK